jgi:hypothetical protein
MFLRNRRVGKQAGASVESDAFHAVIQWNPHGRATKDLP